MSSRLLGTTIICAAAAAELSAGATPAGAVGASYVALGDSYSSGNGTRAYLADGTNCQRSVYAYPSLVASGRGFALNLRACSGATTADVTNVQLSALSTETAYVTITVGGNDTGFANVLTECAKPAWASDCNAAIDRGVNVATNVLPAKLTALYAAIRNRAPRARVVVVGYPRIFNGQDCNALTWFSATEETRLNASADLLNSKLGSAATAAGFTFANPTNAFDGHAVCDTPEWLNGLSNPTSDSYHPNRTGHSAGYAPLVSTGLTGAAVAVTDTMRKQALASAAAQAARQRTYAPQDLRITPKTFVVPDLNSPELRAAAARAGVDIHSRDSVDAADRAYDAAH